MSSLLQPEALSLLLFSFAEGLVASRLGEGFWGAALFPQLALGWAIAAFAYIFAVPDVMQPAHLVWLAAGLAANSLCVLLARGDLSLRGKRNR